MGATIISSKNAQEAVFLRKARDLYAAALKKAQTAEKTQAQRQSALDAYGTGQLSEQATDRMLEDIDERESIEGTEISPEAELHRIGMSDGQHSISPVKDAIDLSKDSELSKRVAGVHGATKYKIIQAYILEVLGDQPVTLSDGKKAVVDRSDALHIANKAADKKTAQISKIRELVETAELYAEETQVEHNKFDYFCYYKADVKYEGEVFPIYLNVGRGINDGQYHIYDITNKIRDTADRINGLERPKPNEGYALTNGISANSIRDGEPDVKQHSFSEPTVRKEDVISNLRAILQKGGDPAALRQYVASLEQNTGKAEQDAGSAEQNGGYAYQTAETAEQILEAARAQEISVEEYLEQNWERYDVDGQWNAEARKALEQEEAGNRRQYSISMPVDDEGNNGYSNTNLELRGDPRNMPKGSAEWHAFNRSFANKTSDIKAGEERELYITTSDYIYLVTADGYMQGYANKKIAITESRNTLEEYFDGIDTSGEGLDHWAEVVRANQGRHGLYDSYAGERRTEEITDRFSSGKQNSDTPGDPEGSEEDNSWLEADYPPGALVYDGNGNTYRADENGNLALDSGRQYSISETVSENTTEDNPSVSEADSSLYTREPDTVEEQSAGTDEDIRGTLPRKAQRYLKRAERALLNKLSQSLSVPWFARRSYLQPMVEEISDEYLRSGTISQETVDRLFEKAYEEGALVDNEFYNQYVELKKFFQSYPVTLAESNRADFADYDEFLKQNKGSLRIVSEGGMPVDTAYRELRAVGESFAFLLIAKIKVSSVQPSLPNCHWQFVI